MFINFPTVHDYQIKLKKYNLVNNMACQLSEIGIGNEKMELTLHVEFYVCSLLSLSNTKPADPLKIRPG